MRTVGSDIEMAVSPEKIILAFTDDELLRNWWGVERCLVELKPGGIYTLAWDITESGIKYVSTGIIKAYDPSGLLHIEKYIYLSPGRSFLGPQGLKITAVSTGNGCKVSLAQGPYPENVSEDWNWYYEAVADAWPKVLVMLKQFLEAKFPQ
ncbi:MAG TPA: SRPBCC domain-containing protein [Chitinophagaceae bacterium]